MELRLQPDTLRIKNYIVLVPPIAWKRPGLHGQRFYDGQQADKVAFGLHLLRQHGNEPLFSTPIALDAIFYMRLPLTSKKRTGSEWHVNAPDTDNLLKYVLDAIKNILITDDRIICSLSAKKIYSKEARTEFTIRELE